MASAEPLVPCSPERDAQSSNRSRYKATTNILRGVNIATAGNLGPGWTDADVARWMGYNGGRFVTALSDTRVDGVTHVLSTLDELKKPKKKQSINLQRALTRGIGKDKGRRPVHIVVQDWLEDSLYKRRRLRETGYLLKNIIRESKRSPEEVQKKLSEQQARGQRQSETFINSALYRVYQDCTGFQYKVTISRDHESAGILGERYVLYLFESLAKPPLYWFAARHYKSRKHSHPRDYRPSSSCGLFATEFAHFCAFFHKKTGIVWDARLVGVAPEREADTAVIPTVVSTRPGEPVDPVLPMVETAAQSLARMMACVNGEIYGSSSASTSAYFTYEKPAKGQPVGAIEHEENLPKEVSQGQPAEVVFIA